MVMTIGRDGPHGSLFRLPDTAVTQTFGILAKRRGGKSYTAAVMAEEFAKAGVPFTILDPTGAWWGLRASADGQKPGLPVVILGGAHGDAPLDPGRGKEVADLVVDHPGFYVLDLEAFESNSAQDRFVTAFAERLYRRKATNREPMHLFIDEADSFVPQRPGPQQLTMLGAFEAIVRRGGIRGIGTTLISQRAAVVNKNVLTQLDTLIALQTTGPQDQDAVIDWVKRNATPEQLTEFKATLASLPRGTAWVYSPELNLFQTVAIRERRTFNSSATPEVGEAVLTPKKLATVDLAAVTAALAESIEKANANDPVLLKRKIVELQRQIENAPAAIPETIEVIREVIPERTKAAILAARKLADEMEDAVRQINAVLATADIEDMRDQFDALKMQVGTFGRELTVGVPNMPDPVKHPPIDVRPQNRIATAQMEEAMERAYPPREGPEPTLKAGARRMLDLLARHHPVRVTRAQWATLAGMKVTGGTWGTYLSILKRHALIEESDGLVQITAAGLQVAGVEPGSPMTKEEVLEVWRSKLKFGARNMLDVLTEVYPRAIERATLASRINMEPTGGTFGTYLSTLKRNGLADIDGPWVKATEAVMGS